MIKIEDIKVGSILQIRKADLEDITGSGFVAKIDPNNICDSFAIKVVDIWLADGVKYHVLKEMNPLMWTLIN